MPCPLAATALSLLLTFDGPGPKSLAISVSSDTLLLLLLGGVMATGQVIGGRLGSHAAMRFGPKLIRPLLVVICLAMVGKLLLDPANPLSQLIWRR